ncbi:MAG TPA: molybdopterin converting factor subunit 1 [Sphingomonas sp.]|nr:molybdopterin converting factor subunit 1 [Sphingomonas sp.]
MKILYFAWVREQIGLDQEEVDPPMDVRDIAGLVAWLALRSPAHATALCEPARIRAALDNHFAAPDAPIAGACEVALFPPVTGG